MQDEVELSEMIGEIYDASLDPAMWPDVVGRVVTCWNGRAGCFVVRDLARQTSSIEHGFGVAAFCHGMGIQRYLRLPRLNAALSCASTGEAVRLSDLMTADEFTRTRFYRNWMEPYGLGELVFVPVCKGSDDAVFVAMACREGQKDDCDLIRLIAPHLEHALGIGRSLKAKQAQAASLGATLDNLKPGVFFLNRRGHVIQANRSGHAMLGEAQILHAIGGELRFRDAAADRKIKGSIGTGWKGRTDVSVEVASKGGENYIGRLFQLNRDEFDTNIEAVTAVFALFVYKTELETASPLKLIAEAYSLTPAEMRVFLAVIQLGGIPEAAEVLGIARNTARALLQRVYNKTGVNRQTEIAKLLWSFCTPLTS